MIAINYPFPSNKLRTMMTTVGDGSDTGDADAENNTDSHISSPRMIVIKILFIT
jgi:hypothetical protein